MAVNSFPILKGEVTSTLEQRKEGLYHEQFHADIP